MYILRAITDKFMGLLKQYPVVTVMGPRQSGKTTLVKFALPDYPYVNLEDPSTREIIQNDPKAFLKQYARGVILDEIQRMPDLLSYIQVAVDAMPDQTGSFVLTGSHQLELHQAVSQSLAGRTALLTLLPLSLSEIRQSQKTFPALDRLLLQGFYPRIYEKLLDPTQMYRYYFQTYVERDIRQLIHLRELNTFQKFIKLCVGRIGQVINYSNLSNEVGISATTVKHWLSLLEASYVIILLKPYYENFGKRVIKSPKLYFTDVGLATYLLDIENETQVARDPLRGNLFENLVIVEFQKKFFNQGRNAPLYYFRDQHGNEVDLLIKEGNQFTAIEIKASTTFTRHFLKGLHYFQELVKERYRRGLIIYGGEERQDIQSNTLLPYLDCTQIIDEGCQ
jgi:predicted AAA+ superfamily ATPase